MEQKELLTVIVADDGAPRGGVQHDPVEGDRLPSRRERRERP